MLSFIRIQSDLVVETCFIGTLSIESARDSDNILSFSHIQSKFVAENCNLWMLVKS